MNSLMCFPPQDRLGYEQAAARVNTLFYKQSNRQGLARVPVLVAQASDQSTAHAQAQARQHAPRLDIPPAAKNPIIVGCDLLGITGAPLQTSTRPYHAIPCTIPYHTMCKSATSCQCIWPCGPRQRRSMLLRRRKGRNKPRVHLGAKEQKRKILVKEVKGTIPY